MRLTDRVTVVVLTHNRASEVLHTVAHAKALPEAPSVIVVDNGSTDNTAVLLKSRFPDVRVVELQRNVGAAGRNAGVQCARTPYIAFCDDDSWWAPGSLALAATLLDALPAIAVLSARVLIEPDEREDPVCAAMASSALPSGGLPGRAILGFLAGASVFRKRAYCEVGGYEPRLFSGGEEALLALDLAAHGWLMVYAQELTVHHHPSQQRDMAWRARLAHRNDPWVTWLRRSPGSAVRNAWRTLRAARHNGMLVSTCVRAALGLPWIPRKRRAIPSDVEATRRLLDGM